MRSFPQSFISACALLLLADVTLINAGPIGSVEGHVKIISPKEVELADGTPSQMSAENHADYPLVILSRDKQTEVAHVTADENGNYRIALPPGDYVLDVQNRRRRHVRVTPRPFRIVENQIVHVDMTIDTGVR
jgi:hypothetical protein